MNINALRAKGTQVSLQTRTFWQHTVVFLRFDAWKCLVLCVCRPAAAGRHVCSGVAVWLSGRVGSELGRGQHASGGLQQLQLRRWRAHLHQPHLRRREHLHLELLVHLGLLQLHLRTGTKDAIQVRFAVSIQNGASVDAEFCEYIFLFFSPQISGSWGWWCKLPVWGSPAQTMWPRPVSPTVCPWPAGTVCRRHLVRRRM